MDEDLKRYIERYCRMYGLTPEEAMKEKVVQDVKEYYEETKEDLI